MKTTSLVFFLALVLSSHLLAAQQRATYNIQSPNGAIAVHVEAGAAIEWSVMRDGRQIIAPSALSLQLGGGDVLGENARITSAPVEKIDNVITAINYKKAKIADAYTQLTLNCKNGYGVVFRAYNDGAAYRFFTTKKGEIIVNGEEAAFNFPGDPKAFIAYMENYRDNKIFNSSFESQYKEIAISRFDTVQLAMLPLLVDVGNGMKAVILEADLEDYPGMFLTTTPARTGFKGVYAPYPLEEKKSGWSGMNSVPTKRAAYIARTAGTRAFPWRAIVVSASDKELLDNDMVQKLASPSRIADPAWIAPGQVAWDWWNDWNISHVDFKAGINTATYKYYIDFAAANKIKYIIMDEGWSARHDLATIVPDIDLRAIIDHGKQKGVDVILWALWNNVTAQMDTVFPLYAHMGVKGFKIDFIDRDDQVAVASTYAIAKKAAEHHLLVDYHGVFKPTGLQRTYPNVVGYEGVKGMENVKWSTDSVPGYDVTLPYIRMMAGPMDYTPGAMRNAIKANFRPLHSMPMSQGTRCHQLAMYVVFEAPLQMLSDNPTAYMREQECTNFITSVPTTFDETTALGGTVGEYAAIARRKADTWYVGAMTNWNARELSIDCSFLGAGTYKAVVMKDGVNADRDATDYTREEITVGAGDTLKVHCAPGGGWAARFMKIN